MTKNVMTLIITLLFISEFYGFSQICNTNCPSYPLGTGESENKILSGILILCIYLLDNHLTQITQAKGKSHISGGKAVRKAIFKQNQYELPMNII